jgi:hypothetical protein
VDEPDAAVPVVDPIDPPPTDPMEVLLTVPRSGMSPKSYSVLVEMAGQEYGEAERDRRLAERWGDT